MDWMARQPGGMVSRVDTLAFASKFAMTTTLADRFLHRMRSVGLVGPAIWANPGAPVPGGWTAFMRANGGIVTPDQFRTELIRPLGPSPKSHKISALAALATQWAVRGYRITSLGMDLYQQAAVRSGREPAPVSAPNIGCMQDEEPEPEPDPAPPPPAPAPAPAQFDRREAPLASRATPVAAPVARRKENTTPWVQLGPKQTGPWGDPSSFQAAPPGVEPDPDLPERPRQRVGWDLPELASKIERRRLSFVHTVKDARDCKAPPPAVIAKNNLFGLPSNVDESDPPD